MIRSPDIEGRFANDDLELDAITSRKAKLIVWTASSQSRGTVLQSAGRMKAL
jgi:hypothetical protein